jgi:hypothetical protein
MSARRGLPGCEAPFPLVPFRIDYLRPLKSGTSEKELTRSSEEMGVQDDASHYASLRHVTDDCS